MSNFNLEPDYWPTEGWRTSTPEEQGMSSIKLEEMYEYINSSDFGEIAFAVLRSVLIIRNGFLVHEKYNYWHENRALNIYSCTKSFTSALLGIAIEKGFIGSVRDRVIDYFPNRTFSNLDARKEHITIEDLLTMRSGLSWDENNDNPNNDYLLMYSAPDTVQYILGKPIEATPGSVWEYNTGNSHILSALIDKTTENGTRILAQEQLFEPLGIDAPSWSVDSQKIPYGGSNLRLTPREMGKFGFLYLNNGTWDGQQIVQTEWIANSTRVAHSLDSSLGYGYQWWISPNHNYYSARGYLGQFIVVIPNHSMVVVFTAEDHFVSYSDLIENFIIPAVGYVPLSTTSITTTQTSSFPSFITALLILSTLLVTRKRKKK